MALPAVVSVFKPVPFFANRMRTFGLFWPILAILSQICALFTGSNSVAVYQNWQISGMHYAWQYWYLKVTWVPSLESLRLEMFRLEFEDCWEGQIGEDKVELFSKAPPSTRWKLWSVARSPLLSFWKNIARISNCRVINICPLPDIFGDIRPDPIQFWK